MTTGEVIRERRKALGLTMSQLAQRVIKDDGTPISAQYLCDVEADRRTISNPLLVRQLAEALQVAPEVLWYGTLPQTLRTRANAEPAQIVRAFEAFRRVLTEGGSDE